MIRSFLVALLALGAGCGAAQPVDAFDGLKAKYAATEAVEFSVENTSSDDIFYWIRLEKRRPDEGWDVIYTSLAELRNDMSEPKIESLGSGKSATIRWVPAEDNAFMVRHERGARDYRLVLRFVNELRDERDVAIASDPFRID